MAKICEQNHELSNKSVTKCGMFLYQVISKGAKEKNFYGQESCNDM